MGGVRHQKGDIEYRIEHCTPARMPVAGTPPLGIPSVVCVL